MNPFVHRIKVNSDRTLEAEAWLSNRWKKAEYSSTWGWKGHWRKIEERKTVVFPDGSKQYSLDIFYCFQDLNKAMLFKLSI